MRGERKIGLFLATMLVAGGMVGGIFLLPATLAQFGSITTLGWLLGAGGALIVARVLGRLGRDSPEAGGAIAYAGRALGPYMGFQATALYWVSCWVGNISVALVAIGYLAHFFPGLAAPAHLALAAVALIWAMTLLNLCSPRLICQVEMVALFAGLVPIVVLIGAGWWYFHPSIFLQSWNVSGEPAYRALPPSLVLIFWAFVGLESASIGTAFVENPERNVARATIYGVLLAAAVFLLSSGLIMGLIPARQLASSTAPFADAVRLILGPAAAGLVALGALVKSAGSLGAWILMTTQTGQAGSERGQFPLIFSRRNRWGVPWANLVIVAVITSFGVWATVSPTLGQQFGEIISVSVILTLLLYVTSCLALWREAVHERGYALAALVFCLAVILGSGEKMLAWTAAIVVCTSLLYPLIRRRSGSTANPGCARSDARMT